MESSKETYLWNEYNIVIFLYYRNNADLKGNILVQLFAKNRQKNNK